MDKRTRCTKYTGMKIISGIIPVDTIRFFLLLILLIKFIY